MSDLHPQCSCCRFRMFPPSTRPSVRYVSTCQLTFLQSSQYSQLSICLLRQPSTHPTLRFSVHPSTLPALGAPPPPVPLSTIWPARAQPAMALVHALLPWCLIRPPTCPSCRGRVETVPPGTRPGHRDMCHQPPGPRHQPPGPRHQAPGTSHQPPGPRHQHCSYTRLTSHNSSLAETANSAGTYRCFNI